MSDPIEIRALETTDPQAAERFRAKVEADIRQERLAWGYPPVTVPQRSRPTDRPVWMDENGVTCFVDPEDEDDETEDTDEMAIQGAPSRRG